MLIRTFFLLLFSLGARNSAV